jgi:prolyl-tRNA synthetase
MKLSVSLIKTLKQSTEGELPGHQLLIRAGLIRRVASGIYSLTPLAYRAIQHIETIIREEMERIEGQGVLLPVVQPAELWQKSGRYFSVDNTLTRFSDRNGHPMVLAMTHEESITDLARSVITSYRQLPQMLFQIQTKFRDELRPRAGLIRVREFRMKDAYSFHTTTDDLDQYYKNEIFSAYSRIFERVELPVLAVQSDSGMMGGRESHEFMYKTDGGEDTLIFCSSCNYAANQEVAIMNKRRTVAPLDIPVESFDTPDITTIADLAIFDNCSPEQTLKMVFYQSDVGLVLVGIRGDLNVNEVKLSNLLGYSVRGLTHEEAQSHGLVIGATGPLNLPVKATLVIDDSIPGTGGLITGANKKDVHFRGVAYGRDYTADFVGDIAQAATGHLCSRCGEPLIESRGIEVANIFKLGTKYSVPMHLTYLDAQGQQQPVIMGCYGLGIERLLACIVEEHHDNRGIVWPDTVAPYQYHLVSIGKEDAVREASEKIYTHLGTDKVLYDDREISSGVKFADADLLGMPKRITVSTRSLAAGGIEVKDRKTGETRIEPIHANVG